MKKNVVQILKELIEIPSYKDIHENHEIVQYLEKSFSDCCEIKKIITQENNSCHLLIGVNTKLRNIDNCIVFSGHMDTISPSKGHLPVATHTNDSVEGLGAADMKCFLASLIHNKEKFKNSKYPIVISITSDEEYDFYGVAGITKKMQELAINPALIIIGEPTNSNYSITNIGNTIFASEMKGKACHTSTPQLGVNAINLSAKFITEIEKISKKYENKASICVISVNGGGIVNVVPDSCTTKISVRTSNISTLQEITNLLKAIHTIINAESRLMNVFSIPPFDKKNNDFAQYFSSKTGVHLIESKFTTEAGDFQLAFNNAEIIIYGPGNPDCIHKAGEKINIKDLLTYTDDLVNVVNKYSSFEKNRSSSYERVL
jgi:acetylornithine deacetylase/succinyl-diaminopimelate desuccinylase-like protein